ncbi:MAG TPA: hypothetical protein VET27_19280 [Mycobacterium sp.]|nr:hypothetical protein [Mycobacterium sp.]
MTAPVNHVVMRNADGAGRRRHVRAVQVLHQKVFHYLARTLR